MAQWSGADRFWFSVVIALLFFVFASAVAEALVSSGFQALGGPSTCTQRSTDHHWWALLILSILVFIIVWFVLG